MSKPCPAPRFSIIMPVCNEAAGIVASLHTLQPLRAAGHELIVVDGGSHDGTLQLANGLADLSLLSQRGRAQQMNAGAAAAQGDILIFLHADTELPQAALHLISTGLSQHAKGWGRFDVRLSGTQFLLRIVETLMNWRSRYSGIATGDQAIFVRRDWFEQLNGFPDIPLMEDIALSRKLKQRGLPLCLRATVLTSSRRWEQHGIVHTILLMWRLRLAYALGTDPQRLLQRYYKP